MSGDAGSSGLWQLLDAVVYTAAGLALGVLLAIVLGRGRLPRVPDTPAALIEAAAQHD